MRTLRSRLILSHILPLIIIIPLIGIALIYLLETQLLLTNLADELTQQATLTAQSTAGQADIWQDAARAQIFVTRFNAANQSEIRLLDASGNLLASADPAEANLVGQPLELPNLSAALSGNSSVQINYSFNLQTDVVEVLVPVSDPNKEIVGIVRLVQELSGVQDRFLRLRYLVGGVLAVALLVAVSLGLVLALSLERSLRSVTQAIYGVASGRNWTTLPEQGPEEMRLLLRAFNTLIERLRLLEEARRRLLANIVHEVGRPIGALQSAIQALLGGADQDSTLRRELLEGMAAEVERLHPLLDNLANLHDQVLGALELHCQPTDLSDWLKRTAISWREAAHAKGLHWNIDIPANLPNLEIDADRMAQVLGNLLSNAIKYTPAGGTVSIAAGTENDEVWIGVSDTGPGIMKEEQERIFEPFHRSQPGRRFPQGMGLGLTIAHDLVEAHGGRLVVDSTTGQGSRFTLWLPQTVGLPKHLKKS